MVLILPKVLEAQAVQEAVVPVPLAQQIIRDQVYNFLHWDMATAIPEQALQQMHQLQARAAERVLLVQLAEI
jgi:hypothetical protein